MPGSGHLGVRLSSMLGYFSMPDYVGEGRRVLALQPFSKFLRAELVGFVDGCVELRIPIRTELEQHYGFVHGGVISSVADSALTFAGATCVGSAVVTSEFKINFTRPAKGDFLVARATVVHCGRTQAVCHCDVFASAGGVESLCATALGTIVRLSTPSSASGGRNPGRHQRAE